MSKIDECMAEYKEWCKKLNIRTVSDINRVIEDGKSNWLINISETWHEQKISEIAERISGHIDKKKMILISGPSSSGKTSFATRLQLHLKVKGISGISISLDDYYKDICDMPIGEDNKPDFEALESIDYNKFNDDVATLISGKEVWLPTFDFINAVNIPNAKRLKLEPNEVIIVEGLHGLNEKLTARIPDENKYKIYCSALTALSMDDGTRIKSRTTRLIRRLIRDYRFRNADFKTTFELWPKVEAGAEKYVFPYTDTADIIFNSSLLYEFTVYKNDLLEVLEKATVEDKNFGLIQDLKKLVESFKPIDKEQTPRISLIREFVGGSTIV